MSASISQFLLLACSLVLAFPPNWCCLLPARQAETTTAPSTPPCCHHHRAESPDLPAEQSPPIRDCCCSAADSLTPPGSETPQPDTTVSAVLLLPDMERLSASAAEEIRAYSSPPSRSLQLLQCVWRC
ncbi:MAG TPA: hypothetical protein VH575_24540 [Gemmataceae bacterium]